jgi:hypothetical protein
VRGQHKHRIRRETGYPLVVPGVIGQPTTPLLQDARTG